jgi:hypothetical protein
MLYKAIAIVSLVLAASSCTSFGPEYSGISEEVSTVDESVARIVVLRRDASSIYHGRSTPIKVNNENIASCPKGGFVYFDVEPKPFKLSVETWDHPGECALQVTPEASKTYYFEISPRTESLSGVQGAPLPDELWVVFEALIMAAHSVGDGCKGMFSIEPMNPYLAERELQKLRLAE